MKNSMFIQGYVAKKTGEFGTDTNIKMNRNITIA